VELISVSDDPTRPVPSGWPEQPPPYRSPDGPGSPDPYGRGDRDGYQGGHRGYQGGQGGYQGQGGQQEGWSQPQRPNDWGQRPVRPEQKSDWGEFGHEQDWDQGARPRKRHRGLKITAIVVVILLILAVVVDRVAVKLAENEVADQIKSSGFPVKPSVTIEGFPFLTQVAAKNFHQIDMSASNVREGVLEIASVKATMHGVHVNSSFNGATVDQINGTALITFAGLSNAAGLGDGLKLSNAGHNDLKATLSLGPISTDALAQVVRTGPRQIQLKIVSAGDLPVSALGDHQTFTFSMPKLPAGMTIKNVSVTGAGVQLSISGSHTTFSQ
jgi:hypothetical protein